MNRIDKNEYVHFYTRYTNTSISVSNYALDLDVTGSNFLTRSAGITVYTNIEKFITGLKTSIINDISHGFAIYIQNKTNQPLNFRKTHITSFESIIPIKEDFNVDARQGRLMFYSEQHRGFVAERGVMISLKKDKSFYEAYFTENYSINNTGQPLSIDDLEYFSNITYLEISRATLHTCRDFITPPSLKCVYFMDCVINDIDVIIALKNVESIMFLGTVLSSELLSTLSDIGFVKSNAFVTRICKTTVICYTNKRIKKHRNKIINTDEYYGDDDFLERDDFFDDMFGSGSGSDISDDDDMFY